MGVNLCLFGGARASAMKYQVGVEYPLTLIVSHFQHSQGLCGG